MNKIIYLEKEWKKMFLHKHINNKEIKDIKINVIGDYKYIFIKFIMEDDTPDFFQKLDCAHCPDFDCEHCYNIEELKKKIDEFKKGENKKNEAIL